MKLIMQVGKHVNQMNKPTFLLFFLFARRKWCRAMLMLRSAAQPRELWGNSAPGTMRGRLARPARQHPGLTSPTPGQQKKKSPRQNKSDFFSERPEGSQGSRHAVEGRRGRDQGGRWKFFWFFFF
jgi:hypothetical protein